MDVISKVRVYQSSFEQGEPPKDVCYIGEKHFWGGAKAIEIKQLASVFQKNWDWSFAYELQK